MITASTRVWYITKLFAELTKASSSSGKETVVHTHPKCQSTQWVCQALYITSPHTAVWPLVQSGLTVLVQEELKTKLFGSCGLLGPAVKQVWSRSSEPSSLPTLILLPFLDQALIHPHVSLHLHIFPPRSYTAVPLVPLITWLSVPSAVLLLNPRHPQNVPSDWNNEGFRISVPPHTSCTESG